MVISIKVNIINLDKRVNNGLMFNVVQNRSFPGQIGLECCTDQKQSPGGEHCIEAGNHGHGTIGRICESNN